MAKRVKADDVRRLHTRLMTMKGYRDVLGIRHARISMYDKEKDKLLDFDMTDIAEFLNNMYTVLQQSVQATFVTLSYEENFTDNGVIWITTGDIEEPSFDRGANGIHIEPNGSEFADLNFSSVSIIAEVARFFKEWWDLLDNTY